MSDGKKNANISDFREQFFQRKCTMICSIRTKVFSRFVFPRKKTIQSGVLIKKSLVCFLFIFHAWLSPSPVVRFCILWQSPPVTSIMGPIGNAHPSCANHFRHMVSGSFFSMLHTQTLSASVSTAASAAREQSRHSSYSTTVAFRCQVHFQFVCYSIPSPLALATILRLLHDGVRRSLFHQAPPRAVAYSNRIGFFVESPLRVSCFLLSCLAFFLVESVGWFVEGCSQIWLSKWSTRPANLSTLQYSTPLAFTAVADLNLGSKTPLFVRSLFLPTAFLPTTRQRHNNPIQPDPTVTLKPCREKRISRFFHDSTKTQPHRLPLSTRK